MKVKVIEKFVDVHTKKLHPVNEIFECDKTRFDEIKSAGNFVVELPAEKKAEEKRK